MVRLSSRAQKMLQAIRSHADFIMDKGKDPLDNTPFFINAYDPQKKEPLLLDTAHVRPDALLSNTAIQQKWLRLLAGLSALSGEFKYREAAQAVYKHLLLHHTDRNGLLLWGGHLAYDFLQQQMVFAEDKGKVHELKFCYPDYGLMWEVDPVRTRHYIEAMWNSHILDWSNLDFNRHADYDVPWGSLWDSEYNGGEVFFWGQGLTFANTGSDLYYAAGWLSSLTGEQGPLIWAKRLAHRFAETRQNGIGISGYQFSQCADAWCDGPSVRGDRAQHQLAHLIPEGHLVYEGTIFKPRPAIQRSQLFLSELLGEDGSPFLQWAVEELTAWGKHSYRQEDNSFVPVLTDGYSLEGLRLDRKGYFGPEGKVFKPIFGKSDFFWLYAMGYRLSGDDYLWTMLRNLGFGLGMGDIGQTVSSQPEWNAGFEKADEHLVYGLLELYKVSGREEHLEMAFQVGERLLNHRYADGCFLTKSMVMTDDPVPLALLNLIAAESHTDLNIAMMLR